MVTLITIKVFSLVSLQTFTTNQDKKRLYNLKAKPNIKFTVILRNWWKISNQNNFST